MNLYSRARKHIDMKRVKEMREERIKEQQIMEQIEKNNQILEELKEKKFLESSIYSNWRQDL